MGARSEIKEYLRSDRFRDKLVRQYARYEILSEGGLRTAVANLLHTKIENIGQPAEAYRVTCETRIRFSYGDRIPDVLIWKGEHPRMWIELKDTRNFDQGNAESDILCFCVYGIVLRPCLGNSCTDWPEACARHSSRQAWIPLGLFQTSVSSDSMCTIGVYCVQLCQ